MQILKHSPSLVIIFQLTLDKWIYGLCHRAKDMGSKMIIINSSLVKHRNEKQVFNDSSETFCQYHLLNLSNPIIFVQCTTYYDT